MRRSPTCVTFSTMPTGASFLAKDRRPRLVSNLTVMISPSSNVSRRWLVHAARLRTRPEFMYPHANFMESSPRYVSVKESRNATPTRIWRPSSILKSHV